MDSSKEDYSQTIKKNIFKRRLHGRIFLKINTTFNTHMLYQQYSIVHTEREFSKTNALGFSFLFIFLSRWINSNKFELIHLRKNMKSTLTLSINIRLKVTRVLCILIGRVIDSEKEFYLKNRELKKTFYYYYLYLRNV